MPGLEAGATGPYGDCRLSVVRVSRERGRPIRHGGAKLLIGFGAHVDHERAALRDVRVVEPAPGVRLAVPGDGLHVGLLRAIAYRFDDQRFAIAKLNAG